MKKIFIYTSTAALAVGIIYFLYEKLKDDTTAFKSMKKNCEYSLQEEKAFSNSSVVEDMYQSKSERAQAVFERHTVAGEIMKDAYSNIMEDFVDDFSKINITNGKKETGNFDIDNGNDSVMKEFDSISNEIDNLFS